MNDRESLLVARKWVVYRTQTISYVYTGIEAASRQEALDAFHRGEGEMRQDRTQHSEWKLDAVDVRE